MKTFNQFMIQEAKVHPMAVHAYSVGGGNYKVHAVGSKVEHVKAGETIRSSDLDDLTDAGHKVKEINKPMSEARNYPKSPTGMGHSADAHFNTQPKKMQDAINLHLRKGKDYPEAVKAAKVHVKEAEENVHVSEGLGDVYTSAPIGDYKRLKEYGKKLGSKHKDYHDVMVAASHMGFGNMDHLKKHIDKLNPDVRKVILKHVARQNLQTLGYRKEEVEIDEALGTIKNMKAASKFGSSNVSSMIRGEKARKAGMAKVSTTKDIGYKVVDVGPGQKETVRKMHNFKEQSDQVDEAESGLSTKTLANYSIKASDASKHRTMPTSKVDKRYAGVSKVDKILTARDKKKVD